MLLFRNVVGVIFAFVELAGIVEHRHQHRQKGIAPFQPRYLEGNDGGAPGVFDQKFRHRLADLAVESCLRVDQRLLDALVQAGTTRLQHISDVVCRHGAPGCGGFVGLPTIGKKPSRQ